MLIGRGNFVPGPPHELRGGFTLTREGGHIRMDTSDDFFFDGSPEPGFGLHSGIPANAADPVLRANMTATRFLDLPPGIVPAEGRYSGLLQSQTNLDDFDTIVLWCFAVPFILGYGHIERL